MSHENRTLAVRLQDKLIYNRPSEGAVLLKQVRQHNEAFEGRGLQFLRSFLSRLSSMEHWGIVKPIYDAVASGTPESAVPLARSLLAAVQASPGEQFIASQVGLLVKKYPFKAVNELAEANGLKKFLKGETRNAVMDSVLRSRGSRSVHDPFLWSMQKWMRRLLGERPVLRDVSLLTGFGPGASVSVNGRFTNYARKLLAEEWTVTASALPYVITAAKRDPAFWELLGLARSPAWSTPDDNASPIICVDAQSFDERFRARCVIVDYNQIAFVPKDADEFRTIAAEPLLNSWYQKGLELKIKLFLRRFGIDLRDQQPNQVYAREGSLGGENPRCTIDLRNASGCIFTLLVKKVLLLCPEWFQVFNDTRSPAWRLPGSNESVRYKGFMSMGNGFCFPLMTAIFASMCAAAHEYTGTPEDFRVYGDDIIIRQNEALVLLEILRNYGFEANLDKTFIFGPFRESCGTDWHSGRDVRPVYVDTSLDSIEERIRLHNAFVRLPSRWGSVLASACTSWFPSSFSHKLVRPFGGDTDEAIDGSLVHWVGPWNGLQCVNFSTPAWYGLTFHAVKDEEITEHASYNVAYMHAALIGGNSDAPFSARRETRMRVARFSHSGNTSNWLPIPPARFPCGSALIGHALAELSSRYTR